MGKLFRRLQRYVLLMGIVTVLCVLSACNNGPNVPTSPKQVARPDLTFTGRYDLEYQQTLPPTGNDLYIMVVEIRNQGTASTQNIQVVVHSKGPGIEGVLDPLENAGYYSIAVGETIKARFQFIFEKQFWGEYEFTVEVDPSNAVQEEDDSNNQLNVSSG